MRIGPRAMSGEAFATSRAAIEAAIAADRDDPAIDPCCVPLFLHHGGPAARAVALVHGFTNCPRQFARLAELVHAQGANVYVPRLPLHGLREKDAEPLAALRVDDVRICAKSVAGVLAGLGTRREVLGLSLGGSVAAWIAQNSPIERAVVVAPFFSVARVPSALEPALARVLDVVPNMNLWWDPIEHDAKTPAHAYPKFATRALGCCLDFAADLRAAATHAAPRAASITLALNTHDPAIDNASARDILTRWQARGAVAAEYAFTQLPAIHDIIDPASYPDAERLVYPELMRLLLA